jgi:uncharacterized protein YcbK (DUF882 family)
MGNFGHLRLSDNFKLREFRCKGKEEDKPCSCHGAVLTDSTLVSILQEIRESTAQAIRVTSAFRCDAYNRAVGGHPSSFHRVGLAADITSPRLRSNLESYALEVGQILTVTLPGQGNVIWYPDRAFIHVDVGHRIAELVRRKDG